MERFYKAYCLIILSIVLVIAPNGVYAAKNEPPVITSSPETSHIIGSGFYYYNVTATDPNDNISFYAIQRGPTYLGLSIDYRSGGMTWNPSPEHAGTYEIEVYAEDARGLRGSQQFTLTVVNNNSPSISSDPIAFAHINQIYNYQVDATDLDGHTLTYSLETSPEGMQISSDGLLTWSPTEASKGVHQVTIAVKDIYNATTNQSFRITASTDNDSDGLVDFLDHCVEDPLGDAIDKNGCTVSQLAERSRFVGSKIPSTGKSLPFHAFDDASYLPGKPRNYTKQPGSEIVLDVVTGLIWQDSPDAASLELTHSEAKLYCENLVLAGISDWKLPTKDQLFYLVDHSATSPDTVRISPVFEYVKAQYDPDGYWSEEVNQARKGDGTWGIFADTVRFRDGSVRYDNDTESQYAKNYVRCVSGNVSYAPQFAPTVNGHADLHNGLMWQRPVDAQDKSKKTWFDAIQYCENLSYASATDWRLPTVNELNTIYRNTNLTSQYFYSASYWQFWTSTTNSANEKAYSLGWATQGGYAREKSGFTNTKHVRCVRETAVPTIEILVSGDLTVGSLVTLDGSQSSSADGDIVEYSWYSQTEQKTLGNSAVLQSTHLPFGNNEIRLNVKTAKGITAGKQVTVQISAKSDNKAPVASSQQYAVVVGSETIDIALDVYDENNDVLSFEILSPPQNGILQSVVGSPGLYKYLPNNRDQINDGFQYRVHDYQFTSEVATVTIAQTSQNYAPISYPQTVVASRGATFVDITLQAHDANGHEISYQIITSPEFGTLTVNELSNSFRYTPNDRRDIADKFSFSVSDYALTSNVSEVSIKQHAFEVCTATPTSSDAEYRRQYPDDNINWIGGDSFSVEDIELAFNHARRLDPSVHQYLLMPAQAEWDLMSVQEKGLFLVNAERVARGIKPYTGVDSAMVDVAKSYADFILNNNIVIDHFADGLDPELRMLANPYIAEHADFNNRATESIAGLPGQLEAVSDDKAIALAIYLWLYFDKDWFKDVDWATGPEWGHRDHILQTGLDENHGSNFEEGIIGFGVAKGLYRPITNPPTREGAVTVIKTIDPGPYWDASRIQQISVEQAQGCQVHNLDIVASEPELNGLNQITILPESIEMALGQNIQLTVLGRFDDGSERDISSFAQFNADLYSLVSVANGVLRAERIGTTSLSASVAGIESNSVSVSIVEHEEFIGLQQLNIAPSSIELTVGQNASLSVTGLYEDGNQRDLTALAKYNVMPSSMLSVQDGMFLAQEKGSGSLSVNIAGISSNIVSVNVFEHEEFIGLQQVNISPTDIALAVGESKQLTVTGSYLDGSQADLTGLVEFAVESGTFISIQNGIVYGEEVGDTGVSVKIGSLASNKTNISVWQPADPSILDGTEAESLKPYFSDNAAIRSINPFTVAVYTGVVHDRYGVPLQDAQISLLHAQDYGWVETDIDGRFYIAGPAGEQTVVYEKPGHVVAQRTMIGASSSWASLPTVVLLERDSKQSLINLESGIPQVHQSSVINDEFGERRATVVFNGITSAEIRSQNGTSQPITQFMFSATEFETPASMPGELPAETAFTWASDLYVDGTHYTDSVHFNADVVLYLDNFLGFPVGEIVPVGYFDRTISKWIASPNGVVVRLLDSSGDGTIDGVDYNDDGIADDINNNGSTVDEAIGLDNYDIGDTLWRAAFNHMTPYDLNWAAAGAEAPQAIELLDGDTGAEDEKNEDCANTGSFAKPYQQSFHEDIAIAGTNLRLHYSSQRTSGYKHKIHVAVSGDNIPASLEKMIARFEIAGRVFEQEFNPAPNVEAEFIWDGTHPDGSRVKGIVSGRISIGFEYPTVYLSSGNAAETGQPLSSFPVAWATLSNVVTQVPGRESIITWQQRRVSIKNSFDSQLAEGWSLSNVHEFDPKGKVYFGSGMVADVATSSLILRTGQTHSHVDGDDGYYQAGGRNIDYVITADNTVFDRVTTLEWQNVSLPPKFVNKVDAQAYCANLPTNDENAWRLPTPKEIGYTIDKAGTSGDFAMYSISRARRLWNENTYNIDNSALETLCVKGTTLNDSTISGLSRNAGLEVVIDKNSGLMWQDSADNTGVKLDWQSSIAHCEASEHAGFDDWRLPNINELLYALPNQVFEHYTSWPAGVPWSPTAEQRNPYWSSTTNLQNDEKAWAIESASFNSERFDKLDAYNVRCVRQDSTSSRMPFRFNNRGQHTATFDNSAGKDLTLYQYDEAGKLSQIVDRFGNTLTIERDPTGRVTAIVAPDGQRTQLSIDSANHLTAVAYEDGSDYQFFYQEGGLLAEKTDPNNYIFGRHYNALGRVERVTAPEGAEWQFFDTRDARGINRYGYSTAENNSYQTERKVLADGSVQYNTTNESGGQNLYSVSADELSETSTAYGVSTTVTNVLDSKTLRPIPHTIITTLPSGLSNTTTLTKTYAENGADTSVYTISAQSNGKTSTVAVNARSGVTQSTSPEGRSSTSYLDPQTLLLSRVSVPGLLDTTYSYDNRGRLLLSSTGDRHTSYVYDAAARGQVSSITAADGKVTSYEYDDLGRVTRVTYPDGHSTQTQYDANGNAIAVIVPSAEQHDFTVNGVGNTDSETRPVASTTQYVYNRDKQLTAIQLPSGDSINYVYQNGRLLSTQTPEGTSNYVYLQGDQLAQVTEGAEAVSYSYDGTLLTALSYSGELNTSLSYSYNSDLQIDSLSYAGASTYLSYDNDGLVTGIHGFGISYRADNGLPQQLSDGKLSQNWLWNGYGAATSVQYQLGTQQSLGYALEYNSVGQITRKTERQHDGSELVYDYAYDDRYRLVEVKQNGAVVESYGYDANGNRTSHSSLLRGVVNQTASYVQGDQLAQSGNAVYGYDANGRLSQKTVTDNGETAATQYQYSSTGRLLAVTTADKTITYRHNALGQRVAKLVDGVVTEKYLWQDLTTLLAVYDANDNVKQRFEYGLSHTPVSFTQSGQRYYIQTDHLGSPRVISSATGMVIKTISYDSYGNVISDSNPDFTIPFGFAGGLQDSDTGLIRFGYRDYDPETGRWTARDPIGFAGGDTNLYGYVSGDPVNFIDPTGLYAKVSCTKIGDGNFSVKIEVPIAYSGSGALPVIIDNWKNGIESNWSGQFGAYNVQTSVTNGSENKITVPGGDGRAFVNGIGGNTGEWPALRPAWTAAHEAGHLMGLQDRYDDNGVLKGYEDNIMAIHGGVPSEQDIKDIIKWNKASCR